MVTQITCYGKGKSRKSEQILERGILKTAAGVHSSGSSYTGKLALPD